MDFDGWVPVSTQVCAIYTRGFPKTSAVLWMFVHILRHKNVFIGFVCMSGTCQLVGCISEEFGRRQFGDHHNSILVVLFIDSLVRSLPALWLGALGPGCALKTVGKRIGRRGGLHIRHTDFH